MQTKSLQFRWYGDNETDFGLAGFVRTDMPHFDPVQGFGLAHDMVEHFTPLAGTHGEIAALAASIWVRVEGSYWSLTDGGGFSSPREFARTIGEELGKFLVDDGGELCPYALSIGGEVPVVDKDDGEYNLLRCMVADMIRFARRERPGDYRQAARDAWKFAAWGYTAVQEHYGTNAAKIAELFWEIEQEVDQYIASAQPESGDCIEVRLNPDYTFVLAVIDGRDLNGDYFENGEPVTSEDEDDE